MMHSMIRPPSWSPSTPNIGAASVPRNCSEPKMVSSNTEPVLTITYQPRMTVSISNAHDVRRSAGHWKRKLRTRKEAKVNGVEGTIGSTNDQVAEGTTHEIRPLQLDRQPPTRRAARALYRRGHRRGRAGRGEWLRLVLLR